MGEINFGDKWMEQNVYPSSENPKTIAKDKEERENEASKIYNNPDSDPVIIDVKAEILRITNKEITNIEKGLWGEGRKEDLKKDYGGFWARINRAVEMRQWDRFVREFPKKAEGYKGLFEPITDVFERQVRSKNREKAEEGEN